MTSVLTHRGLEPSKKNYFLESSFEAFSDQVTRGFGLEFDPQPTADGSMCVFHDPNLTRITQGENTKNLIDLSLKEISSLTINNCHIPSLSNLVALLKSSKQISAIHLKRQWQEPHYIETLLQLIEPLPESSFIIFDLLPESASYIKGKNPRLQLAASVAHPFDIQRYGESTGYTLLSLEDLFQSPDYYTWAWLDEWDRKDDNGNGKIFYSPETFSQIRQLDVNIALVSPELHHLSPGLLGAESHPDAHNLETLTRRIEEILALRPDIICTDYPDLVKTLL